MSSSSDSNQKSYPIDLKNCIEQYTWKRFKENRGCFKRLLVSKKKHYVDVRWGYLHFEHKTKFEKKRRPEGTSVGFKTQEVDLYVSDYENKTSITQQYTFSATRETRSSASVEVHDTYTLEGSMNLEIDLGGIAKLGGGFSPSLSVTKTSGETFEKALTWEVNAEVRVKPWHKAIAYLCVSELNRVYNFEVKTTVSLPQGHLPVAIRRKSDDKIIWAFWVTNLPVIFDEKCKSKNNIAVVPETLKDVNRIRNNIVFITPGVCKIVFWTGQHVKVESKEMENIPEHIKKALKNEKEED